MGHAGSRVLKRKRRVWNKNGDISSHVFDNLFFNFQ